MTFREWIEDAKTDREKYIWRVGVACFGVPWGVLSGIIAGFIFCSADDFANHSFIEQLLKFGAVFSLFTVLGPFCGYCWGIMMWPTIEAAQRQKSSTPAKE
jgi:hypothetical protein